VQQFHDTTPLSTIEATENQEKGHYKRSKGSLSACLKYQDDLGFDCIMPQTNIQLSS